MTDLTTTHLKYLLDQATSGPWEAKNSDCITSEHGEVLWNADQAVDWNRNDHDVNLAAAAPQLAQEVIRLREQVKGLILAMETKAANNEQQNPAIIAGYLKEIILGDHDE
ncbi:hypothetical protein [uncultured Corynebacterium sp.]|uniref:hypothetical protein n=1 Tax=uncultured Corynebacterium sp. TaxID=159447 RepID=UPI002051BE23|nr:hypothetical protein [uncultured Corynebacterium sp.]DAU17421.1 MAG TPA: Ead/Ea22-like protein [Caudoviricetes sp.]